MNTSKADRRRTLALRAFPPRWCERHGDELLHVSGELASSSERDADWQEFVDIVRGGLSVRFEDRPPWRVRAAYHWFEKPVPARWHPWMRDDLRGRFLGYRRNLQAMFPLLIVLAFLATTGGASGRSQAVVSAAIVLGILIAGGPFKARQTRRRMNAKVGYDIAVGDAFPPPTFIALPVLRRPAARLSYVRYAVPFAIWTVVSGTALIAGAASPNAPNRSVGAFTFSPDPNSPLTAHQVAMISVGVAIAVIAVAVTTVLVTVRRVRTLALATIHESRTLSVRGTWLVASLLGAPATFVGALGVMPDLACATVGAGLVIAGAAGLVAAVVVARRDAELGRHISLAELLVGERDPATHIMQQHAGVSDH